MTSVYLILIIVALVMLLLLIPINLIADFAYDGINNSLYLKFLFIRINLFPNPKSDEHTENEGDKGEAGEKKEQKNGLNLDISGIVHIYHELKDDVFGLLGYILTKALAVKTLNISAVIGTGEPMYTGLLCGAANAAVYGALGTADAKMKIKNHRIDMNFDFDNSIFRAGIYTVIYTRAVYICVIAVKALIILFKLKKILKEVNEYEQSGE